MTASIAQHFTDLSRCSPPSGRTSSGTLHQKTRRRCVTPKGWTVCASSAATARTRKGGVSPRLCATSLLEGVATRTHTLLFHARWVARSSVGSRVATPRWPPDRCAAGLDFLWGAEAREGRHLLQVLFCPQAHARHVS